MLRRAAMGSIAVLALASPALAAAQLLPSGFFQNLPQIGNSNISVTADSLTYGADNHTVLADGNVDVGYDGYTFTGDHLVFDQHAHTAHFVGNVVVHSPDGSVYRAPDMRLSGPMHDALMSQLSITTKGGALITAGDGDFQSGKLTTLNQATYQPCGTCIDAKGHRIGWSAKAVKMVYDNQTSNVTLDQPTLYLLGVPIAWVPWLSMPDPSKRLTRLEMPSFDSSKEIGAKVSLPYFIAAGPDTDILLTPSLMTRQGLMMAGEWDQRFPNGALTVKASGVDQRDPAAFAPYVGDSLTWRGAIQSYGEFRPTSEWTVGWSYTAFTDPAYFTDYRINVDRSATNQVYATQLTHDEFFDVRLQEFNLLGDYTLSGASLAPAVQGKALPNTRYHNVIYLPQDRGELDINANLLGVDRAAADIRPTMNGVPYQFGDQEAKVHGMAEVDWQKRWIAPGGFVLTPFLGLRADAAYADFYDSTMAPALHEQLDLFNATPIAAIDVRYPMIARTGPATHVVEPIAQLVYRASNVTDVGITNDDAQSFIFDDTNLFSYNRFSGIDRQETGLRANVGGHYQLNFDSGAWFDLLGGESFQLAGTNAFAQPDPTQVTTGQGLSASDSYVVLGAQGALIPQLSASGKLQVDPATMRITRSGFGGSYTLDSSYIFNVGYLFVAPDAARGVTVQQQEATAGLTMPVPYADYWKANVFGGWDLAANTWLSAGGGVHYDDGYLRYGADITATGPTNATPNDFRVTGSLFLRGLGGTSF